MFIFLIFNIINSSLAMCSTVLFPDNTPLKHHCVLDGKVRTLLPRPFMSQIRTQYNNRSKFLLPVNQYPVLCFHHCCQCTIHKDNIANVSSAVVHKNVKSHQYTTWVYLINKQCIGLDSKLNLLPGTYDIKSWAEVIPITIYPCFFHSLRYVFFFLV